MNAQLVHRSELTDNEKAAMFALLVAHFSGVCRHRFELDLAQKDWVVCARDDDGSLSAFTTFAMYATAANIKGEESRPVHVVCSGDTIVDRSKPASTALLRTWLQSVLRLHAPNRNQPLYWLLIVSGFRTYRFLPVFFQSFYPRFDRPTPPRVRELMTALAIARFGEEYHPHAGIVRFKHPQVLRHDLNGIPHTRSADPHIDFFNRINPKHERGDELVCLTELHESNLTPAGMRMADARRVRELAEIGA